MRGKKLLPPELETIREAARLALGPVIPATSQSHADHHFLFDAQRTEAGRELPPYYLVYFLLVSNFLGSRTSGSSRKLLGPCPSILMGERS